MKIFKGAQLLTVDGTGVRLPLSSGELAQLANLNSTRRLQ